MAITPEQRQMRARMGGHAVHATHDSHEIAARARAGFDARFEREVDPEGVLPLAERKRRAVQARKLYFTRLAYASAKARKKAS